MDLHQIKTETIARIKILGLPFSFVATPENREYGYTVLVSGEVVRNSKADFGPNDARGNCHLEDLGLWELALCLEAQESR